MNTQAERLRSLAKPPLTSPLLANARPRGPPH